MVLFVENTTECVLDGSHLADNCLVRSILAPMPIQFIGLVHHQKTPIWSFKSALIDILTTWGRHNML